MEAQSAAAADATSVRGALATLGALAALGAVGGFGTGAVRAEPGSASAPSTAGWHAAARLDEYRGRLKRVPSVQPTAARPNAWRRPAMVDDLAGRQQAWRTAAPAEQTPQQQAAARSADDYDIAVVAVTNDVRRRHGLVPLRASDKLAAAATKHSRAMGRLGFFTHESADGSAFWKRVQAFYPSTGAAYWAVGENLIWASPELTVSGAIRGWLDSPGHRDNMLSPEWREIGCASVHLDAAPGVYGGRKVTIITCDFGVRR